MTLHESDSLTQRKIEAAVLQTQIEIDFAGVKSRIQFDAFEKVPDKDIFQKLGIRPDGVYMDGKCVAEIYVFTGGVKPAKRKKIATDVLKIAYLKKHHPDWNGVIVCNREAKEVIGEKSWLSNAMSAFQIQYVKIDLTNEQMSDLASANAKQASGANTQKNTFQ